MSFPVVLAFMAQSMALGAVPPADGVPRIEFAFEERVTLAPAVVLGETALGQRQFIPITGGTVAGPRLKGAVVPGGWDFQLTYTGSGCTRLSADYFLKADDGTLIHVANEGFACSQKERLIFRPVLEAPKGAHEWLSSAVFVATLELEMSPKPADGSPATLKAVRIRFFQVR